MRPPFLVLELLEGHTLADRLRRDGALPAAKAARIAAAVADRLDVANRAGIIHRDIKPSNIMLTASGGVKVMDFGIAEIAAACEAALAKDPAGRPASAGALAAQLRAAVQAAQASADTFSPGRIGSDRPAEPTRRLSADQTQVVGEPHKLRSQSHRVKAAAAVVAVVGAAGSPWRCGRPVLFVPGRSLRRRRPQCGRRRLPGRPRSR